MFRVLIKNHNTKNEYRTNRDLGTTSRLFNLKADDHDTWNDKISTVKYDFE